ncbi:hypothetical protein V5O48_005302 [Marasmius crinis-equi]|uniref:Uncharacterized protein n=1 Tax=Marasmius crinis-equi TaxID=585013 RepID=A0ABR3FMN0_9AGAR
MSLLTSDRKGFLRRLSSIREKVVDPFTSFYLPCLCKTSLSWVAEQGPTVSSILVDNDPDSQFDKRKPPEKYIIAGFDDDGYDSDALDDLSERLSISDDHPERPVQLVVLVLESIQEHRMLALDFDHGMSVIRDLCEEGSTQGWKTDIAILDSVDQSNPGSTNMILESLAVSCVPGAIVEVSFILRRIVVLDERKERFQAEMVSVKVHMLPPDNGDSAVLETLADELPKQRVLKRARLE